jgi:hypothetical protein
MQKLHESEMETGKKFRAQNLLGEFSCQLAADLADMAEKMTPVFSEVEC